MSYILNALRKSERERQAIEPDTVSGRIVIHHSQPHKNSTKLIAALIVINLGILVYFLGFTQKTAPVSMQIAHPIVEPEISHVEIALPSAAVASPPASKTFPVAEAESVASITASAVKTPSAKKPPIKPLKPAIAPPQPVEPVKPRVVEPAATPKKQIDPVKETMAALKPLTQPIAGAKDAIEKIAPRQPKNDLPFLDELPSEVSRSVPNLSINVFSYSSIPAERFVMIDMVKYIPGQRIKDQLELREIREDSIVVNYDDRTFKIRRP